MTAHQLATAEDAVQFITAGNATFTLVSARTGTRFTYRVREAETTRPNAPRIFFVSVLTGADNENAFELSRLDQGARRRTRFRVRPPWQGARQRRRPERQGVRLGLHAIARRAQAGSLGNLARRQVWALWAQADGP